MAGLDPAIHASCEIQFSSSARSAMNAALQKRERGVAQYDKEYFKKQFEGLPPKAQAIIALARRDARAAVLGLSGKAAMPAFRILEEGERDRHALAIIRCYQASAFVNSLTKADNAAATSPTPPPRRLRRRRRSPRRGRRQRRLRRRSPPPPPLAPPLPRSARLDAASAIAAEAAHRRGHAWRAAAASDRRTPTSLCSRRQS